MGEMTLEFHGADEIPENNKWFCAKEKDGFIDLDGDGETVFRAGQWYCGRFLKGFLHAGNGNDAGVLANQTAHFFTLNFEKWAYLGGEYEE